MELDGKCRRCSSKACSRSPFLISASIAERCSAVVSDANALLATFRSGSTPGKPDHQSGQGDRVNRLSRAVPVELDAVRAACPARRRLAEVIRLVLYSRRVISAFDPMLSWNGGDADRLWQAALGAMPKPSCSKQVSGHVTANPPTGFGPYGLV